METSKYKNEFSIEQFNSIKCPFIKQIHKNNPDITFLACKTKSVLESKGARAKKTIYLGLIGTKSQLISALLHELGHCRFVKINIIEDEKAAWDFAKKYAKVHKLPFDKDFANETFMTYKVSYDHFKKNFHKIVKKNNLDVSSSVRKEKLCNLYYIMKLRNCSFDKACEFLLSVMLAQEQIKYAKRIY